MKRPQRLNRLGYNERGKLGAPAYSTVRWRPIMRCDTCGERMGIQRNSKGEVFLDCFGCWEKAGRR